MIGIRSKYHSRVVFLCASTLNSAWILMRSATDVWPGGLGSCSDELGHNLMDHHFRVGAWGVVNGFDDKILYGHRPNGFYIPRYRNLFGDCRDYLRGFGYQGSGSRQGWDRDVAELGIGAKLKAALTEPGPWVIGMIGFGETLPRHSNKVSIDPNRKDKWGLPVIAVDCQLSDNEHRMREAAS